MANAPASRRSKTFNKTKSDAPFQCPLCGRAGEWLTPSKHHLVPRSRDGRVTADVCVDCHKQIHALFTLPELACEYDTLDKLRAAEPMQRWIAWAARQRGGRVAVRASRAKKDRAKAGRG